MKRSIMTASTLVCLALSQYLDRFDWVAAAIAETGDATATDRQITLAVMSLLRTEHLVQRDVDVVSVKAIDQYIKDLDPNKLFFTSADIEEFSRGRAGFASALRRGDVSLAYDIYRRYQQQVERQARLWRKLLDPSTEYNFTVRESMIVSPDALEYLADDTEASERWRQTLKYDLLQYKTGQGVAKLDMSAAREKVLQRFDRFARLVSHTTREAILQTLLTCVCNQYDRNSRYMSPSATEAFQLESSGEMAGIGARLRDDAGIIIEEITPNGAAAVDGRIMAGDRILSVGQGQYDEMIDLDNLTMDETVRLLRGKSGTTVRIRVASDKRARPTTYALTRSKIQVDNAIITPVIFEQKDPRKRIGYIELPSFYRHGDEETATKDVEKLLKSFLSRDVDALVLDLRRNQGGYLSEAISLPDLFLHGETVLQVRGKNKAVNQYKDVEAGMAWDKPLVVLVSKQTAAAAEIFCAAMQDHNRGLIVGDEVTAGAGTVQQLLNVGQQLFRIPNAPSLGMLWLTNEQHFRPTGDAIEVRGVRADVVLPSLAAATAIASEPEESAVGFDRVPAVACGDYHMLNSDQKRNLQELSYARRQKSPEFNQLLNGIDRARLRQAQLIVSLNEQRFLEQQRAIELSTPSEGKSGERDYYLGEALAPTADYVRLLGDRAAPLAAAPVVTPRPQRVYAARPVPRGPTDEQLQNGMKKIVLATIAHATATADAEDTFANALVKEIAKNVRKEAVSGAVSDIFPQLSAREKGLVSRVTCAALDGQYNADDLDGMRGLIADALRANQPDWKEAVDIADTIAKIAIAAGHARR